MAKKKPCYYCGRIHRDKLPKLKKPDPITIHDLTPKQRERAKIKLDYGMTRILILP